MKVSPPVVAGRTSFPFPLWVLGSFLCSFVIAWFLTPSSVGIGDWDQFFSDAWLSANGLEERGWPALWTIQIAGGAPLAGDPQSISRSPLLVSPLLFGPIIGVKLLVVVLIVAGLIGCQRLGERWIGDPYGAVVFAFSFVFSGYFALHLRAGHFPWALFYLAPWLLLFLDRLLIDPAPRKPASLGWLTVSVLVLSGPVYQSVVYFVGPAVILYILANLRGFRPGRIDHVRVLFGCALLITIPRWFPMIDWQWQSPRQLPIGGGMPFATIAQMLLSSVEDYRDRIELPNASGVWEYGAYLGPVTCILAAASLLANNPYRRFAIGCIACGIVLSLKEQWGSPLAWVAPYVPVISSVRVYSRFIGLATFGLALSAGSGFAYVRAKSPPKLKWLPMVALVALVADYSRAVLPIWTKTLSVPLEEVYSDWGRTVEAVPYFAIRTAPPFQPLGDSMEMLDSRMLPLLMAKAIVRNPYSPLTLPAIRLKGDRVIDSDPHAHVGSHRVALRGAFSAGQRIETNLRFVSYWRAADPSSYRFHDEDGTIELEILRPCRRVVISMWPGWEIGTWIVSALGLAFSVVTVSRSDSW